MFGIFKKNGRNDTIDYTTNNTVRTERKSVFAPRKKYYVSPGGRYYTLYEDMLEQPHLLIAGTTGSGKSTLVNELMHVALLKSPAQVGLILIDPKRVELCDYKGLPHTLRYASEPEDMVNTLQYAIDLVDTRYKAMQREGLKKYNGSDVYVVIDELADLMTTDKKHVMPLIQRLCQIGRGARVHVIACTQCPIAKVIPTEIKVNFDSRVGLRTACAQDSRNILGVNGCERLPQYGFGYYSRPSGFDKVEFYKSDDVEINRVLSWWRNTDLCMTNDPDYVAHKKEQQQAS